MGDAIYLTPLENEKKQPSELYFDKCLNKACQNIPYTLRYNTGPTLSQKALGGGKFQA